MKNFFTMILLSFTIQAAAQEMNQKIHDSHLNKEVMLNLCTREELASFPEMKEVYTSGYAAYSPDPAILSTLKTLIKGKKVTIVMGTWCGDSKLQVPHFYKIMDLAGVPAAAITLICVDGEKKAGKGLIDHLKIERVPTFIFTENNQEIGRITESPLSTLEEDSIKILTKKI